GYAWPANCRILYNRAAADPNGRPWSERKRYAYENTALRDAARPLTVVCDARVLMDTLDSLVEHGGAPAHALALDGMRQALGEAYCEVRQRVLHDSNTLELVEASLRAARARAKRWSIGRRGWSVLGAGLQR